jgi:hypothetical protein
MAAFEGKKTDVMPWFADLTYWYSAHRAMGTLPSKYEDEGRINLYKDLGCGAHEELYGGVTSSESPNVTTRVHETPEPDGGYTRYTVFYTPIGELRRVEKSSKVSYSRAIVEHPVKTEKDLKILRFIFKDQRIEPSKEAFDHQSELMNAWEGWGIVSSLPPRTPLSRLVVEWAGLANVAKLQWRAKEEFDETIQVLAETDDPIYEAIEQAPARFVYFGENLSSDIINPKMFIEYVDPYYRRRSSQLHSKGKLIYVHIDGTLRGLLPLLRQTGVDCAQSLTPAPMGDLTVPELRKRAGEGIVLWGGLPGVLFSRNYPAEMLRKTLYEVLQNYMDDRQFIVGVADQVPPDGEIQRARMVTDVIESSKR